MTQLKNAVAAVNAAPPSNVALARLLPASTASTVAPMPVSTPPPSTSAARALTSGEEELSSDPPVVHMRNSSLGVVIVSGSPRPRRDCRSKTPDQPTNIPLEKFWEEIRRVDAATRHTRVHRPRVQGRARRTAFGYRGREGQPAQSSPGWQGRGEPGPSDGRQRVLPAAGG